MADIKRRSDEDRERSMKMIKTVLEWILCALVGALGYMIMKYYN